MARIIYGVSGEGAGHSSRALEMAGHLRDRGHDLRVVTYGQGVKNLSGAFEVLETEGLHFAVSDNKVDVLGTLTGNLRRLVSGGRKAQEVRSLFKDFLPHCVITDFEPMTAYFARHYDIPLVTIDNQHRMRSMEYPCPRRLRADALAAETIIRAMIPRPDVSLVTTFYFGKPRDGKTFLFPPILRREVLEAVPREGRHVLVYLTRGFDSFVRLLARFPREEFLVYGSGGGGREGNSTFKEPSREGFLADLASCKAVISTGGFTLLTESLHLRKPFMALPMRGQFEQELNGLLLAEMGCGKNCRRTTEEAVGDFLYHLPEYRARLREYPARDNREIKAKLDELLADGCRRALAFHRARSPQNRRPAQKG